ncbi:hypothetical protein V1522DRAFT_434067 [Lipomyces starkeyi]
MKIATGLLFVLGAEPSQCLNSLENKCVGIRTVLNVNREHMRDTVLLKDATSRIISCITIQFLMLQNISYNHPIGPKKTEAHTKTL